MSWKRANWERRQLANRENNRNTRQSSPHSLRGRGAHSFALARTIDFGVNPGLGSLLATAVQSLCDEGVITGSAKERVVLQSQQERYRGVTIINPNDARTVGGKRTHHNLDTFFDDLAEKTGTSNQRLDVTAKSCGFFGSRGTPMKKIGLVFAEDDTETLLAERSAALDIINPEYAGTRRKIFPHFTLGSIAVMGDLPEYHLKAVVNELIEEVGTVALMPVRNF